MDTLLNNLDVFVDGFALTLQVFLWAALFALIL